MSNQNIKEHLRRIGSNLKSLLLYLRELSGFGFEEHPPEEPREGEEDSWNLKTFLQQKLYDLGLSKQWPGEELSSRQKWKRNTERVRNKMCALGLDDEPLEAIFENEDRKWNLKTRFRVLQFSLNLTLQQLKEKFEKLKKKWAPKDLLRSVSKARNETDDLDAPPTPLKETLLEKNREVSRSIKKHKEVVTASGQKLLDNIRSSEGRAMLLKRVRDWLLEFGLTPARLKQLSVATAVILGLTVIVSLVRFESGTESELSVAQTQLDVDKEISQLTDFAELQGRQPLYRRGELESRKSELASLRKRAKVNDAQDLKLKFAQLEIQKRLFNVSLVAGAADPEREELESLAQTLIEGDDDELAAKASFELCVADVMQFVKDPSAEKAHPVHRSLRIHQAGFLGYRDRSQQLLAVLANAASKHADNEQIVACMTSLADILSQSGSEVDQEVGQKIHDYNQFAKFKLNNLESRIRFLVHGAVDDLNGAIEQLRSQPETSISNWRKIMRAGEAFVSVSKTEQLEKHIAVISEIAGTVPDTLPLKNTIQELLARQKARLAAGGKSFDIAGSCSFTGKQLGAVEGNVLVVFVDQSQLSVQILRRIVNQRDPRATPIAVFKPGSLPVDPQRIAALSKNVLVASEATTKKYFNQMPVDFFPQIMLVDKERMISATNLYPFQVPSRLAALKRKVAVGESKKNAGR